MKLIGCNVTGEGSASLDRVQPDGSLARLLGADGADRVWIVDCTDREAERVLQAHQRGTLALSTELTELLLELPPSTSRGRPPTSQTYADQIAAEVDGKETQSIRVARLRAKRAKPKAPRAPKQPKAAALELDTLGQDVDPEWLQPIAAVAELMTRAAQHVSLARGELTKAMATGDAPAEKVARLQDALGSLGHDLRTLVPVSLCPACKALGGYLEGCATCLATGWVGSAVKPDSLPPELFDRTRTVVLSAGKLEDLTPDSDLDAAFDELF